MELDPHAEPFALRSFLRCDLCQLRMQVHRRRSGNYYQCEARRRPAEFVPEGHPKMVFVREAPLMEKVLEFLQTQTPGTLKRYRAIWTVDGGPPGLRGGGIFP